MEQVWIRKPTPEQEALLKKQPTWEHEPDRWETVYDDREETCLIIEGTAYVETQNDIRHYFGPGDLVTFQPGLECVWGVEEHIKKYYIFDMNK